MMPKVLRALDMFCGGGGSTQGAKQSGRVKVVVAINHWITAVQTHRQNHPDVRHICARADQIDPWHDFPDFEILIASPECQGHSDARGGRPTTDQKRATGWDVIRFVEAKRPKAVIIENVKGWLKWGPIGKDGNPLKSREGETFKAWVMALESLGYKVEWCLLNSADFGAHTRRIRLFVVARRGTSRPFQWPAPTHSQENWRPAHEIIDWSRPCPSVFSRKRPLEEKTLRRLIVGLRKFCGPMAEPFIVKLRGTSKVASIREPVPTVTAGGNHLYLANPFIVKYHGGKDPARDGTERQYSLFDPLPTIDTNPRFALATPFAVDVNHGGGPEGRVHSLQGPLRTITTKRGTALALPFVVNYFSNGKPYPATEPLSTITTKERHGLAMVELIETMREFQIADLGFRMFHEDELARATGFPAGYSFHGRKEDVIRMIGNAVPPALMEALCNALAA